MKLKSALTLPDPGAVSPNAGRGLSKPASVRGMARSSIGVLDLRKFCRDVTKNAQCNKWVFRYTFRVNRKQMSVTVGHFATGSFDDQFNRRAACISIKHCKQSRVELLVEIGNMLKLLCFPIRSKPREVFPATGASGGLALRSPQGGSSCRQTRR